MNKHSVIVDLAREGRPERDPRSVYSISTPLSHGGGQSISNGISIYKRNLLLAMEARTACAIAMAEAAAIAAPGLQQMWARRKLNEMYHRLDVHISLCMTAIIIGHGRGSAEWRVNK